MKELLEKRVLEDRVNNPDITKESLLEETELLALRIMMKVSRLENMFDDGSYDNSIGGALAMADIFMQLAVNLTRVKEKIDD